MDDPLDNPIWHALTGPQCAVAFGSGLARHYPRDMAPFSAIAEATDAAYRDLARDLPAGVEARLFRPADEAPPAGWRPLSSRPILQMVLARDPPPRPDLLLQAELRELAEPDLPAMLELAALAKPGPFDRRTPALGTFVGILHGGRLVAMAGERIRLDRHVEISAVATHPSLRGRGFAAALTLTLCRRAIARGGTPFLHVFPDNPAAKLYERLGFATRTRLWVLWRQPSP